MANSFALNGTDMAGTNYGLMIDDTDYRDQWLVEPSPSITPIPFGYAASVTTYTVKPRVFDIPCVVSGTSQSHLHTRMDALAYALSSNTGGAEGTLSFDHIVDRNWLVRLTSGVRAEFGQDYARFPLQFTAADARGFSTASQGTTVAISADPHDYTYNATSTAGNTNADPLVYVRNTSGVAVTAVTLANTVQSATISWEGELPDGYWLRFNCDRRIQTVAKSTASGTDQTALTYTADMALVSGYFPQVLPKQSNTIRVTGIGTGTFSISFKERYL